MNVFLGSHCHFLLSLAVWFFGLGLFPPLLEIHKGLEVKPGSVTGMEF